MKTVNIQSVKRFLGIIGLSILFIVTIMSKGANADVIGGYINSHSQEFTVMFDALSTQKILLGASLESIRINEAADHAKGQLYIVNPDGRFKIAAKSFRDKTGVTIAVPFDNFDKVVFLDERMKIKGGLGFSTYEVKKLATARKLTEVARVSELLDHQGDIFEALEYAREAAEEGSDMSDEERSELFTSTVAFTGGKIAGDVVRGILTAAETDDAVPFQGLRNILLGEEDSLTLDKFIPGVDLISNGDNGGGGNGGLINNGDNGGGGNGGYIANGDNGGGGNGGYIANGDNGGGGNGGIVVQGWAADGDIAIPELPNVALNCAGSFIFIN